MHMAESCGRPPASGKERKDVCETVDPLEVRPPRPARKEGFPALRPKAGREVSSVPSRLLVVLCLLVGAVPLFSLPGTVGASVVDTYGWGSRATAMGGAFTALADDFSAVFYNPAGLMYPRTLEREFSNRKGVKFDFGYIYGEPRLYTKDPGSSSDDKDYGSTSGGYLGITFDPVDFHGTFKRKVFAFGLGCYLPVDHLLYYGRYWPEEREYPFFYDYATRFVLMPGVAFAVLPRLSLGVGFEILGRLHTDTTGTVYADLARLLSPESLFQHRIQLGREEVHLGEFEDLTLNLAPVVGIQFRPSEPWKFGVTYRGENYINDFGLTNPVINLAGVLSFPQGYQFKFVRFFTPHQVFCGVAVTPVKAVTLSLDAGWFDWSDYMDIEAHQPEPKFHDTWMPRLGVEYRLRDALSVLGGYFYYASPVPEQVGRSNFLDNDRHVFSIGAEYVFTDPPGFWDKPLYLSLHFQVHFAAERHYAKVDPEDPYYPGYSFGGSVFIGGLQVTVTL